MRLTHAATLCFCALFSIVGLAAAAPVACQLLQPRTAYQTNETIELLVIRQSAQGPLAAGDLVLTVAGDHGGRLAFTLAAPGGGERRVEHLRLDARRLRPGRYAATTTVDGATAGLSFSVHSHIRRSEYKLVNWGANQKNRDEQQWTMGEDSLGFNVLLGHYVNYGKGFTVNAGVDYMRCCTMSGGHQMDLRTECDWSDPYVTIGGRRRMAKQAFIDRTRGNVTGVHAYDEPGLTWWTDPVTDKWGPHMIPAQVRAYEAAFGAAPLHASQVDPANPDHVRRWRHWARWKLGFMDAAWQEAQFGVSYVSPKLMTLTQSQYGFSAFTDGYYFNVVRSLPATLGHGGYHDWGPGYFNPSMTLEIARARDLLKPCWYMPTWYGSTSGDLFRLEQYLSFQTNIQGLMTPPPLDPFLPDRIEASTAIVESNKVAARLGTIFNHMPVTRPPVAMLYSLSHMIHHQATRDMEFFYGHGEAHGANVYYTYLAGKLIQQPLMPIADEDIVDGTLAAHHRALVLTSIDFLDPAVVTALQAFIAAGGKVYKTADSEVEITGAIDLGVTPGLPAANVARIAAIDTALKDETLSNEQKTKLDRERRALSALRANLEGARPLAAALAKQLKAAGIRPVFSTDQEGLSATRQVSGDIEYVFAVNATHDLDGSPQLGVKAVKATVTLATGGRSVYDAMRGRAEAGFAGAGDHATGAFSFGAGAMRVWALTRAPIAGVKVGTPVVRRDTTRAEMPLSVQLSAALLGTDGTLLSGAVPLRVRLTDPLGVVRYDLYRAAELGVLALELPLAANDPTGDWRVAVTDLRLRTCWPAPRTRRVSH
jgi:hypothetical protein